MPNDTGILAPEFKTGAIKLIMNYTLLFININKRVPSTNSSCTILLWIGILWFIRRPICLPGQVVDWQVPKLFLAGINEDTTSEHINKLLTQITTLLTRGNWLYLYNLYEQSWITRSFKIQMHVQCNSVSKQKRIIIQTGSARGDAWLRRISANNLLNSFRKCQ